MLKARQVHRMLLTAGMDLFFFVNYNIKNIISASEALEQLCNC